MYAISRVQLIFGVSVVNICIKLLFEIKLKQLFLSLFRVATHGSFQNSLTFP